MNRGITISDVYIDADLGAWSDIDGDGVIEAIYASVFKLNLYKGEKLIWSREIEARKEIRELSKTEEIKVETEIGNILTKLSVYDIDRDGKKEIIVGRADGLLAALDHTGKTLWSADLVNYIVSFSLEDINGDNKPEIIAITGTGTVALLNHKGHKIWVKNYPRDYGPSDLAIYREGDEFFIVLGMKSGGLVILDKKGKERKKLYPTHESIKIIKTADLTGDGKTEFIIGGDQGGLVIVNANGEVIGLHRFESEVINLSLYDLNKDGKLEVIAGDWNGSIKIISSEGVLLTHDALIEIHDDIDNDGEIEKVSRYWKRVTVKKNNTTYWEKEFARWISAIDISDINHDEKKEVIVGGLDKVLRIFSHDGKLLWQRKLLRAPLCVLARDFDNDGSIEILTIGEKELRILRTKNK